jgi:cytochrome P450
VGAPLARLEGRVALGTLFDRFPGVHLAVPADEVIRRPSLVMNSLTALPVRFRPDEA